jgi:hypothetical protein
MTNLEAEGCIGLSASGMGPNGVGVLASGTRLGVYGRASGSLGVGVLGSGFGKGTEGAGIRGDSAENVSAPCSNTADASGWCIGVYGNATASSGIGVRGEGNKYGVFGTVPSCIQGACAGVAGDKGAGTWAGRFFGPVVIQASGATPGSLEVQGGTTPIGIYGSGQTGVQGEGSTYGVWGKSAVWAGYFTGNVGVVGNMTVTGTCFCTLSDGRYKQEVNKLPYGIKEILTMKPVSFRWQDGADERQHAGFIAQDAESVAPELVLTAESGDRYVDPMAFIAVLVGAVQEQQAQIDALAGGSPLEIRSASGQPDWIPWVAVALAAGAVVLAAGAIARRR